jgi:hypothetical protein
MQEGEDRDELVHGNIRAGTSFALETTLRSTISSKLTCWKHSVGESFDLQIGLQSAGGCKRRSAERGPSRNATDSSSGGTGILKNG